MGLFSDYFSSITGLCPVDPENPVRVYAASFAKEGHIIF